MKTEKIDLIVLFIFIAATAYFAYIGWERWWIFIVIYFGILLLMFFIEIGLRAWFRRKSRWTRFK